MVTLALRAILVKVFLIRISERKMRHVITKVLPGDVESRVKILKAIINGKTKSASERDRLVASYIAMIADNECSKVLELRRSLGMNQTEFWSLFYVTQSGGSRYEKSNSLDGTLSALMQAMLLLAVKK
jgi:DNA-binding transcriptional regulator YiaG